MAKKIVIQCCARKDRNLWQHNGEKVKFVAHPELCHDSTGVIYRRPDDLIPNTNRTWRQALEDYNRAGENPFGLRKAWKLYKPEEYGLVVRTYQEKNVFILSAGWGLVRADYLLPYYDITFSSSKGVQVWIRRKKGDKYDDFNQLTGNIKEDDSVYFFGGKDYLRLYYTLTWDLPVEKVIYHKTEEPLGKDEAKNNHYKFCRYSTTQSTNWHYPCVRDFIDKKESIGRIQCLSLRHT